MILDQQVRQANLLAGLALLVTVSGCATQGDRFQTYPPAADVRVRAEPLPPPEAFEDEEAAEIFEAEFYTWARDGWAAVGRICRDAARKGAPYPDGWCPENEPE